MSDGDGTLLTNPAPVDDPPAPAGDGVADPAGSAGGVKETGWLDGVDEEYRGSIAHFKDPNSLAKSYVHAQKMVGADKVVVPGKHATEDDWKSFYQKAGMPGDIKDYSLEAPEGVELEDGELSEFKEILYKNNVMPEAAAQILKHYGAQKSAAMDRVAQSAQLDATEKLDALKNEWGEQGYTRNLHKAALVLREFGSPDLDQVLDSTGFGNSPELIRLLANIGQAMREDTFKGEELQGGMTRDEALSKHQTMLGDIDGPLMNGNHPNHQAALKEAEELMKIAYPEA